MREREYTRIDDARNLIDPIIKGLKAGKLQEDFVEGMMCPGGCIGGPSKHQAEAQVLRDRKELLSRADGRQILENLEKYPMDQFSMFRDGHLDPSVSPFRKKT